MNYARLGLAVLALGWLVFVSALSAQPAAAQKPRLTVAVLDFQSEDTDPELGKRIAETLTAVLSNEGDFTLVDRGSMSKTLAEHELNLTGLVDGPKAIRIGELVGAKILVTGKAFALDKKLFVTAKLIGAETSLVEGVLVSGERGADTGDLILQLGTKITQRLYNRGNALVASAADTSDPVVAIRQKLAGKKLPIVALSISERHVGSRESLDPAMDIELRRMLLACGFGVVEGPAAESAGFTIKGEAVSEPGARIGNLMSCSARVEVKVISADGKTVFADRVTARATDLSEQIAAKTAVQKAAHEAGLKILESFSK